MPRPRVLIVDDSALMRQLLGDILARDPSLEVMGSALDPCAAWERIQGLRPDVMTLDVDMPRMDGLTFLERLMRVRPTPMVIVWSQTERGCQTTLRASGLANTIVEQVRAAAGAARPASSSCSTSPRTSPAPSPIA